jgi:CheY-like chemotaxis protein
MATILVVEDDASTRRALERLMELESHTPVPAENGVAALAALDQRPPHLVLLDLMMPKMGGVEFLLRLRSEARWRKLPVIVISALSQGPLIDEARRLGITANLVKGNWSFDDLLALIESVLGDGQSVLN